MTGKGFTLIELLVVVIIMGVLTSVALPQYRKAMDRAKVAEALQMLPAIYEARERWVIEHQCTWNAIESKYKCADGSTLGFDKLDIESKGTINNPPATLSTNNFLYHLLPVVSAEVQWGGDRLKASGNKIEFVYDEGNGNVCCTAKSGVVVGPQTVQNLCNRLNVIYCGS